MQKEREDYEVILEDGKFLYKKSRQILDTSCGPRDAKWIFVLSTSKSLYVGQVIFTYLCVILAKTIASLRNVRSLCNFVFVISNAEEERQISTFKLPCWRGDFCCRAIGG